MDENLQEQLLDDEAKRQLEIWKEQYQAVWLTEINDIYFVWRGLTRAEYRKALEYYPDDFERSEYVCRLCVLDPVDVDYSADIYAGVPETLAEDILKESGFLSDSTKIEELIAKHEQEMQSFQNQISCIIVAAFPALNIEDVENWSLEKTIWHYSRATWILKEIKGVALVPAEETDPNGVQIQGDASDFPELRGKPPR